MRDIAERILDIGAGPAGRPGRRFPQTSFAGMTAGAVVAVIGLVLPAVSGVITA